MIEIRVVLMPSGLDGSLAGKTCVVFDVLRATTTMIAGFAAGIRRIHAFAELEDARRASAAYTPKPILCGELHALPAPGVDLGNSPGQFTADHAGREMFMATTNGTKALNAARAASDLFIGALVNTAAVARAAAATNRPIVLLGSGTAGEISMEDTIGAGAVCDALLKRDGFVLANDVARMAHRLFIYCRDNLPTVLRDGQGGRNIHRVGLDADVDFAARLDVFDLVGVVDTGNLVIRPQE
jgi:2-phosphosulfolactate phosphatase